MNTAELSSPAGAALAANSATTTTAAPVPALKPAEAPKAKAKVKRRPRPLNSRKVWAQVINPLVKVRERIGKAGEVDPAFAEITRQLEAMERVLWKLYSRRDVAEAQAKDRGVVCWTVFHPTDLSFFSRQRVVTRTPHTHTVVSEYALSSEQPNTTVDYPEKVWSDLELELARSPFDQRKFDERHQVVMAKYRQWLAKGGAEGEAERRAA